MSNVERQRKFRAANPGYYARRRRKVSRATIGALWAAAQATAASAAAASTVVPTPATPADVPHGAD